MPGVGDRVPDAAVTIMTDDGPNTVSSSDMLSSGTVVLFAVPGAFTPVCTEYHLPGFVQRIGELREKGVDTVACIAVNDPFVLAVWANDQGATGMITMLSDPDAEFTKAMGMQADGSVFGLGMRSNRYSMVITNGVIKSLNVETHFTHHEVSTADALVRQL